MPRSVTVTLQDGTQHTYQNVPDTVTPDAINQRASSDFKQSVSAIDGGKSAAPVEKPKSIGEFATNAAADLKGVMQQFGPEGAVAQTVMHPVRTAHALGDFANNAADILTGGVQKVRDKFPDAAGSAPRMDTAAYDKFAGDNYEKYGTLSNLGNTVYAHPLNTAVAAASILDPALKLTGAGEKLSALKDTAKYHAVAAAPPEAVPVPSTTELKTSAGKLYDRAKKAGVVINSQSFANFADDARMLMKDEGIDKDLHPDTTAALNRISTTPGDVSLNDVVTLRKIAGDATEAKRPADKRLARLLMDHIDDYTENLQPHNIVAGDAPKAVALLKQATDTWKNAARGETIDKLIAKARLNGGALKSNLDAAYRSQFKKLADNDRGISRFTPEQQDAIRKVAYGDGPVQGVLHTVGRLIPSSQTGVLATGGIATGAHLLGAPVTGPIGMAVAGAGVGGKIGSTLITSKNAQRASEMARAGSKITPRSDAYYKIQQRRAARTGGQ